ncbi:MAG: hypothetical protein M1825_001453 [Sarcosagium campestre]|nr:MAG: hypothetical protein M1825_001453 [Sarcosagium campestre]
MASLLTGNKFDPNTDIPDLADKIYVVTGGSAGIGFGIVAHLLQQNPAKVYLLSNKAQHADEAVEELKKWGDTQKVEWIKCDLANLKQTDEVAKKLKSELSTLDGLILNAGIGVGKYWETQDGIGTPVSLHPRKWKFRFSRRGLISASTRLDSHFQINVLSQLHLALVLLPILQRTPSSRLTLQSSDLHRGAQSSTAFADLSELNTDIGPSYLYNRTKLAQILAVRALVRRMEAGKLGFGAGDSKDEGKTGQVWINATHPGAVSTDQQDQAVDAYGKAADIAVKAIRPFMKDAVEEGCRSILFASTSPAIVNEKIQGSYIIPDRKVTSPSSQAQDDALGERMWALSLDLLSQKVGPLGYDAA